MLRRLSLNVKDVREFLWIFLSLFIHGLLNLKISMIPGSASECTHFDKFFHPLHSSLDVYSVHVEVALKNTFLEGILQSMFGSIDGERHS